MFTDFVYPVDSDPGCGMPVFPGCTIGQMVRSAMETGVTPDMPSAELGHDDDVPFNTDTPFVDPYGDIRTDWSEMAEKGLPRGARLGSDGFVAPVSVSTPEVTSTP